MKSNKKVSPPRNLFRNVLEAEKHVRRLLELTTLRAWFRVELLRASDFSFFRI